MCCLCLTLDRSCSSFWFNVLNLNWKCIFPCTWFVYARLAKILPRMHCSMPTHSHCLSLSLFLNLSADCNLICYAHSKYWIVFFWLGCQCKVWQMKHDIHKFYLNCHNIWTISDFSRNKRWHLMFFLLLLLFIFWWMNRNEYKRNKLFFIVLISFY